MFFCNKKYSSEYDAYFCQNINRLCVDVWPEFQVIIDNQVEPIDDPDKPYLIKNVEEWEAAPTIGYFAIYVQGDSKYPPDYVPVDGAKIIR